MTNTETVQPTSTVSRRAPAARRRVLRLIAVVATVVLTLAVWAVGRLSGVDYALEPSASATVDAMTTTVFTLVIAMLGWGVLALLERTTRHAVTIWVAMATVVVIVSMVPIFFVEATPGTQVSLFFVHLAVAALVPGLLRARTA